MQHFKPTCAITLGEVTAFVPEARLYQRTHLGRRLSPAILADLTVVAVANDQGFGNIASTVLRGLEARLGVTEHDRVAALAGAAMTDYAFVPLADAPQRLDRLRGALSERATRERPVAVTKLTTVQTLVTEDDLTADQVRKLVAAEAKLASRDPSIRRIGLDEIEEVERWHNRRIEALRRDSEDAERRTLEALRDPEGECPIRTEEIIVPSFRRDDEGFLELEKGRPIYEEVKRTRTRITTRDGLESLATCHLDANGDVRLHPDGSPMVPAIGATERDAGIRYRAMFEAADREGRIKSIMADSLGRRRAAMTEEEIFAEANWVAEVSRAKAHEPLVNVERYIHAQVFAEAGVDAANRAITALRAIAGMGWTLYRLAPTGRQNQQYGHAIRAALTAAADFFGMC